MIKKLKDILNTYTDNELEELDLWIDSRTKVDSIWVEDYNINLITDEAKVEINNKLDKESNVEVNKLNSLNNYLFEQLERLNDDEELEKDGALEKELKRAKAITGISTAIVNNAKLVLDVKKYADELGITNENEVLKLKEKNDE